MKAPSYLPFLRRGIQRSGPPLHLTLFITGSCNLRCRHCFHWKEVAAGISGPSVENVERLAASAARMGPLLWVSFGGGEPFLRSDVGELAAAFGQHGLRHLTIPTNGLIKSQEQRVEEILRAAPDTHLSVSVSFDGPPKIHDSIRQVEGGHARSCASVRQLLKQKRDAGGRLGVGIGLCVTQENQDVLADHLEELVRELRPDNVTVNLARGEAMEGNEHLLAVDVARYEEVVARKRKLMDAGLLPYFDFPLAKVAIERDRRMYAHIARVARGEKEPHLDCTAGSLSAVIFEDGAVHPCEILGESMGQLDEVDWDLERLWYGDRAKELRETIRATRCRCTWECAQADNVLFSPRHWPGIATRTLLS